MIEIICALTMEGMTMAYVDGRPNVYVKRCDYQCERNIRKTYQLRQLDHCPKFIKEETNLLYYNTQ